MLFYAAHMHEEPGKRPADLLGAPSLARYVEGFGRAGDLGVIADGARAPMGAAWVRLLVGEGAWLRVGRRRNARARDRRHARLGSGAVWARSS